MGEAATHVDPGAAAIAGVQLFVALCEHLGLPAEQYDALFVRAGELAQRNNPNQFHSIAAVLRAVNPRVADKV